MATKGRWRKIRRRLRRLLPPWTGSSGDTIFGFAVYGSEHEDRWWAPVLDGVHDALRILDGAWHWLAWRTWDRYHVVRLRMEPGYRDVDFRMAAACFALLGEFVEKELGAVDAGAKGGTGEGGKGGAGEEDEDEDEDRCSWRGFRLHSMGGTDERAIDLWLWYRDEFPKLSHGPAADGLARKDPDDVLDEKLGELMALRRSLWT